MADGRMAEYTRLDFEMTQHGYLSQLNPTQRGKLHSRALTRNSSNTDGPGRPEGHDEEGWLVTVIWSFESCDS